VTDLHHNLSTLDASTLGLRCRYLIGKSMQTLKSGNPTVSTHSSAIEFMTRKFL
jgi:hypothetical protein